MFSSKPYKRAQRVSDSLRKEIAHIFTFEISDPRLKNLTVTQVSLSDDLSSAKVFHLNLKINKDTQEIELALEKSKSFVKKKLGKNIKLKKIPELLFFLEEEDSI